MDILTIASQFGTYREINPGEFAGPCPACGGAIRFRINPATGRGHCTTCGIKGDNTTAGALFAGAAPKQAEVVAHVPDEVPHETIEGREIWFPTRPEDYRRLAAEGKIVVGPKETALIIQEQVPPPVVDALLLAKTVFPGAFLTGFISKDAV